MIVQAWDPFRELHERIGDGRGVCNTLLFAPSVKQVDVVIPEGVTNWIGAPC